MNLPYNETKLHAFLAFVGWVACDTSFFLLASLGFLSPDVKHGARARLGVHRFGYFWSSVSFLKQTKKGTIQETVQK